MPVMDGFACVGTIRRLEYCKELRGRVPVVRLTGFSHDNEVCHAIAAGMVCTPPLPPFFLSPSHTHPPPLVASTKNSWCQDAVLHKPFQMSEVLPHVMTLIEKYGRFAV